MLVALVPELLTAHPDVSWELVPTPETLAIEVRPVADQSRCATVEVSASTEIFLWGFAGHDVASFAYDLDEKRAVLADVIGEAVASVRGPTQVLVEWAGSRVVGSAISHNDREVPPQELTSTTPLARLWWRLRGKRLRRELLAFPALPCD